MAELVASAGEAAVRAIAEVGMERMLDLSDEAPCGIEALAHGGLCMEEKPATEAGALVSRSMEMAVVNEAAETDIEKEFRIDVERRSRRRHGCGGSPHLANHWPWQGRTDRKIR